MASSAHASRTATRAQSTLDVCIGKEGLPVGRLTYVKQGAREYSSFAYDESWLQRVARFAVSPDLTLTLGYQFRKAPTKDDSCFFFALADTEPDAWGRRVVGRIHAKARKADPSLKALTELDYLSAVDDFSRIGALRLRNDQGIFLGPAEPDRRTAPPLLELGRILEASAAVERSRESAQDLAFLQGKGTSLGGMRPKCTLLEQDGTLAIGKFPSMNDERSVTRGEILALRLAQRAGIETAAARIELVQGTPVAVISRFDRTAWQGRIPYLSAASMLQAGRNEERTYAEVVDVLNASALSARADAQQLWRRLAFNHLITNVDDHLQNLGFLHAGNGLWRLAPAFDLNPFPDRDRESKTWLSADTGPIASVGSLLDEAARFYLDRTAALAVLGEVHAAVSCWRALATSAEVGLTAQEAEDFAPAFEHAGMETARAFLI